MKITMFNQRVNNFPLTKIIFFVSALYSGSIFSAEQKELLTPVDSLLPMLFGLVIILAVIFGLAFLFKKFTHFGVSGKNIKILETQMIGNKEKLVIVQVQQQNFLIGVTNQSITQLGELHQFKENINSQINKPISNLSLSGDQSDSQQKNKNKMDSPFSTIISKLMDGTLIQELTKIKSPKNGHVQDVQDDPDKKSNYSSSLKNYSI